MTAIRGRIYVVGDNIDTDQIIPAEYLNLVPTIPEEYRKLGSYALAGLARTPDQPPFVPPGAMTGPFTIIVAGKNFGCGSSREHAPIALGAAGTKAVVAESFARIFFRNCVAIWSRTRKGSVHAGIITTATIATRSVPAAQAKGCRTAPIASSTTKAT